MNCISSLQNFDAQVVGIVANLRAVIIIMATNIWITNIRRVLSVTAILVWKNWNLFSAYFCSHIKEQSPGSKMQKWKLCVCSPYLLFCVNCFETSTCIKYTVLFEMIVGVLTTCHTQFTWDRSICVFYLIEQHFKFLLHTLQVLYMCTLCDSTNINRIMEFVPNCL